MREIAFTKTAPGSCPAYGDYFIQDRPYGRDIHGNECWQYALFRKQHFQTVRRFRTRKQAYRHLSELTGLTRWDLKNRSHSIIINDRQYLGVIYGDTMYRLDKRAREIQTRPTEDERLSGWHDKYNECLAEAKRIITEEDAT